MDYQCVSTNITFNSGRSFEVVSVNLINDDMAEPTEEFVIEIVKITPTTLIVIPGNVTMARGIILDDDGNMHVKFSLLE